MVLEPSASTNALRTGLCIVALLAAFSAAPFAAAQTSVAPGANAPPPSAPLSAQPGAALPTVLLQYRVEIAGTYGLRIDVTLRQLADRYAIDARVRKEGLLATLTSKYRAENQAVGRLANGAALPSWGSGKIDVPDDSRSYRFTYKADGSYAMVDQPPHQPKPGREVSEAQRRGSLDPLTAIAAALLGRTDPCAGPVPVFDSRKRFDLVMVSSKDEALPRQEGPKAAGPARRCDVALKKIAGYKPGDKNDPTDKPSRLWLAKFDDTGRFYPARLEVDTGFGQLVVWLDAIKQRPQNDEDRAALAAR